MNENKRRHTDPMRQEQIEFGIFGLALILMIGVIWALDLHVLATAWLWRMIG